MKFFCDLLEVAGHKVSEIEHVLPILNGLDEEYEGVVVVISLKETSPSLQYVLSTLLAHEGKLDQKKSINFQSISH